MPKSLLERRLTLPGLDGWPPLVATIVWDRQASPEKVGLALGRELHRLGHRSLALDVLRQSSRIGTSIMSGAPGTVDF